MVYVVRSCIVTIIITLIAACRSPSGAPSVESEAATFSGTVREALPAGRYTYLRVHVADGDERWVVVQGDPDHERVTVQSFGRRRDFVSRRLDRTFDELYFASLVEAPEGTKP
jgi:hypothetical protein